MEENVIHGGIMRNVDVNVKNVMYENGCVWNPAISSFENGKCLASITDDSVIMCDESVESHSEELNLKKKKKQNAKFVYF